MTRHRFINDGLAPIPMGSTAAYACVCGRRGSRAIISRHITEMQEISANNNDFDDTQAHYLPMEPRQPATPAFNEEPSAPELPPPPQGFIDRHARSIAESFQDMLRSAYQAGAASAMTGESFERWYQREVLQ